MYSLCDTDWGVQCHTFPPVFHLPFRLLAFDITRALNLVGMGGPGTIVHVYTFPVLVPILSNFRPDFGHNNLGLPSLFESKFASFESLAFPSLSVLQAQQVVGFYS